MHHGDALHGNIGGHAPALKRNIENISKYTETGNCRIRDTKTSLRPLHTDSGKNAR
jgi:hypothetical protein